MGEKEDKEEEEGLSEVANRKEEKEEIKNKKKKIERGNKRKVDKRR